MEFKHTSVLLRESIEGLAIKPDGIYADGTLGGGGHAFAIGSKLGPQGTLIGIDRDGQACHAGGARLSSLVCKTLIVQDNYANIKEILTTFRINTLNGAVLDLGVSSFQLDNPQRGFSYKQDAPLDMRMTAGDKLTAETVINEYEPEALLHIIKAYGEERWAGRIVDFITKTRERKRITTTYELVDIIKAAIPAAARKDGPHPAKRTFQAIRIEVNGELAVLRQATQDFINILKPGGRFCVITFHSLEDRIIKEVFQQYANPCECPTNLPYCICGKKPIVKKISKKPIVSPLQELAENPRARSAKLRIVEKI